MQMLPYWQPLWKPGTSVVFGGTRYCASKQVWKGTSAVARDSLSCHDHMAQGSRAEFDLTVHAMHSSAHSCHELVFFKAFFMSDLRFAHKSWTKKVLGRRIQLPPSTHCSGKKSVTVGFGVNLRAFVQLMLSAWPVGSPILSVGRYLLPANISVKRAACE